MAGYLPDYSGDYDPGFTYSKLSKEALLRLLEAYREYILRIDGFWYLVAMEKWGNDAAFDCDLQVWEKCQILELRLLTEALNIQGDDVATVMKYLQINPWLTLCDYQIDLHTTGHATLTKFTCPILFALEKEGNGREERQCQVISPQTFNTLSHYFNPDIRIAPIRIPPRTDYNDMCCQWEFSLVGSDDTPANTSEESWDLMDYSGEYDPDFNHRKLSRKALLKLIDVYCEYIRKIDGYWYAMVMEQWGNDEAVDSEIAVWERVKPFELKVITEALNICGHDVLSFMKYVQASPWVAPTDCTIDIKGDNHAILTHQTCPTLFGLEQEGTEREIRQCREIDVRFFRMMAHFFHPDMKVIPLKLPPRNDSTDICCQWEFKLDR